MYSSSSDEAVGLLVGVYRGVVTDDDYARCIESIVASDARAHARRVAHTCVLVADQDTASPPPKWRQRMAEANNALLAERYYFAFVSPSLVLRGVFTAVQWLTRGREGHRLAAFPSVAHAAAWIELNAGHPPLAVRRLYERAFGPPSSSATGAAGARAL